MSESSALESLYREYHDSARGVPSGSLPLTTLEVSKNTAAICCSDYALWNLTPISESQRRNYLEQTATQIENDVENMKPYAGKVVLTDLLADGEKVRHDPLKLSPVPFWKSGCPNEGRGFAITRLQDHWLGTYERTPPPDTVRRCKGTRLKSSCPRCCIF